MPSRSTGCGELSRSNKGERRGTCSSELWLTGEDDECLLSRMRFARVGQPGEALWMGCQRDCDGVYFGCCPQPKTGGDAPVRHRCAWGSIDLEGKALQVEAPATTRKISFGQAHRLMNTDLNLADGMPRDWWKLLPDRLDGYRLCAHAANMLLSTKQYKALKSERVLAYSEQLLFDPCTQRYDGKEKTLVCGPCGQQATRPATRKCPEGTCANVDCQKGVRNGRFTLNKKRPIKKGTKNWIMTTGEHQGLCQGCADDAKRQNRKRTSQTSVLATETVTPAQPTQSRGSVPAPSKKVRHTLRGLAGADSTAAVFLQSKLHNLRRKLQRRESTVSTLEGRLEQHLEQQAQVEVENEIEVQLAEHRHADQVLAPAAQQRDIWLAFMADRQKVNALNADMRLNGVEYSVPSELLPILHSIMQVMYNVSNPASADEKIQQHARVILAQVGYHFFSSVIGRSKNADGGAPAILNGLQTRFAILMKEGNIDSVLKETNAVGLTVASRTINDKLDAQANCWHDSLGIDFHSKHSLLLWTDNEEHLVWADRFVHTQGEMEHAVVDHTWSDGLPPPFQAGMLAIQCFCGPRSACQDRKCPCVAVGVMCHESRCGCTCCIFPAVFAADTGTQKLCRHGHFCERAARKHAESEEQATFNPIAKSEDKAEAKNAAAVAQKCMIASGVSEIVDSSVRWAQCQLLPRKQLQEVLPEELTLAGFRVNLVETAQHGYQTLFHRAWHAHTVFTPEYVEYQVWNSAITTSLSKNQCILHTAHKFVHGDEAEVTLLTKDMTAQCTPRLLAHWRGVYHKYSRDDCVDGSISAVMLNRRIIQEHGNRSAPASVQRRAKRNGIAMAAVNAPSVAERWTVDDWGAIPEQCDTWSGSSAELDGWWCLLQHLETEAQIDSKRRPVSLRKMLERIAAAADPNYLNQPDHSMQPMNMEEEAEELGDADEQVPKMTMRMLPLTDGTASDHRNLEHHLASTMQTLQVPDVALPHGCGQYLPYQRTGPDYKRPVLNDISSLPEEKAHFGQVFDTVWSTVGARDLATQRCCVQVAQASTISVGGLSSELWVRVFAQLQSQCRGSARAVCRQWRHALLTHIVWVPRHLVVVTDYAIQQHYEDKQQHKDMFKSVLLVPAMLHYAFAGLVALVNKHYEKLDVVRDLREALNITSDAQERYVKEPTADIRKMMRVLDQYVEAIMMRAIRHFSTARHPIRTVEDLHKAHAEAYSKSKPAGKTHRILQELDFVSDYLPCSEMFRGMHDGDWKRTLAGFVQLGPLLFEAQSPKKSEEWLSHMIRLSVMSAREFFIVTRRCLFHRYYDGATVSNEVPEYNKYGESKSEVRTVGNDENGEDFVGRMKESGAHSVAELKRRSKLFNLLEALKARMRRKRHRSSQKCEIEDQEHLSCIFNLYNELTARSATMIRPVYCKRERAMQLIAEALRRRKVSRRKPIEHVDDKRTEVSYRQLVANMRAQEAKLNELFGRPYLPGSARDWMNQGCKHGVLRRPKNGVPGAGTVVNWPHDFCSDVRQALVRIDMPEGRWGASDKAVLAYLRKARPVLGRNEYLLEDGVDIFTEKFLHTTPLGARQTLDYTRPQLDAWVANSTNEQ